MFDYKWLAAIVLVGSVVGCCNPIQFPECPPPRTRLADVNTERGDYEGRNFYAYRSHELHPDHLRRYDYHPPYIHRFNTDDEGGW